MAKPSALYIPGVLLLIAFLSFSSQWLWTTIEPGALSQRQTLAFNALIAALLICYARACAVDPGRIPRDWVDAAESSQQGQTTQGQATPRWCRKCEQPKPPRAHHCKECARCVTRMDHHCPWTNNCVSHRTMPHFVRFLFYCVAALGYNEIFIWRRLALLWEYRHWPAYHGPSHTQLVHLFVLFVVNTLTLLALALLLGRTAWCLGVNMTTIEGWELERHHSLLRRARARGGFVTGANGVQVRVERVEFPYDIGIWSNICRGMGTGNSLSWPWPFAATPTLEAGLSYETNDFNDESVTWPPPDPDRVPMPKREPMEYQKENVPDYSSQEHMEAFRARQAQDLKRWETSDGSVRRRHVGQTQARIVELSSSSDGYDDDDAADDEHKKTDGRLPESDADDAARASARAAASFPPGVEWRNAEGEQLRDFGVDDAVDYYDHGSSGGDNGYNKDHDDDNLPLAELIARKRNKGTASDT